MADLIRILFGVLNSFFAMLIMNRTLSMPLGFVLCFLYRFGPPTRTDYRVIVENLSSRVSWQVILPIYDIACIDTALLLGSWLFH